MYPEAGGSSSFARHAFNEFWSFFAAWGQMLNYIITVAISAFFVPHYLACSGSRCGTRPGDIVGGIVVVVLLGAAEHRRRQGGGRAEHLPGARRLRHAGRARGRRLRPRVLARHAGQQRRLRHATRRWTDFLIAIPVGMVAYTGIETISNMAEEARDYGKTIPRAIGGVVVAVVGRSTRSCRRSRCRRCRSMNGETLLGAARGAGRLRGRPDARRRQEHRPRRAPARGGDLRRRPGGHDPVHRDERGPDRRVAADLLDGPAPPAARAAAHSCTRSSARPYIAIIVFGAIACVTILPGPGRLPRHRSTRSARCCRSRSRTWR